MEKMNKPTYKELVEALREIQNMFATNGIVPYVFDLSIIMKNNAILKRIKEKKKVYLKKITTNSPCIDPDGKNCYFMHSVRCMEFDCSGIIYVQVPKPNGGNDETKKNI